METDERIKGRSYFPPVTPLHRHAVFHDSKSKLFIEGGVFAFFGHNFDIKEVFVFIKHHLNHGAE